MARDPFLGLAAERVVLNGDLQEVLDPEVRAIQHLLRSSHGPMVNPRVGSAASGVTVRAFSMDRPALIRLLSSLGAEFRRREMASHLRHLRLYYLGLRHRLDVGRERRVEVHWTEEMVVEWMRLLRLPPYQAAYPVRERGGMGCRRCENAPGTVVTVAVFPGGAKLRCRGCEAVWLEVDRCELQR